MFQMAEIYFLSRREYADPTHYIGCDEGLRRGTKPATQHDDPHSSIGAGIRTRAIRKATPVKSLGLEMCREVGLEPKWSSHHSTHVDEPIPGRLNIEPVIRQS